MAGYYDPKKDYSVAIEAAKSLGQDTTQLERERQNKIDAVYGGNEPTMHGSDKTYKQMTGSNANWQNQGVVRNAVNTANSAQNNAIMDAARKAAEAGDWDMASSIANGLAAPDGYYGGVNLAQVNGFLKGLQDELGYDATEYYNRLYDQVYGEGAAELFDLTGGAIQFGGGNLGGQLGADAASLLAQLTGGSSYQSDGMVDRLAAELLSMNYDDWTEGEQYRNLAERYRKQGQDTMQDVIGEVSARTGGLASSYATSAAAQQYNDVMGMLEQVAMEMYGTERGHLMDNLQIAQSLEQDKYNRFLDNRNYLHQLNREAIEDSRYDQQYADSTKATTKTEAQDRINAYLAANGRVASLDAALVEASGYTPAELAALEQYYASQAAAAAKKSSSSGGGGTTTQKPTLTAAQALNALESGIVNDTTKAAYEYYYGQPWEDAAAGPEAEPGAPKQSASNSNYGTSYSSIWSRARTMYDSGKTEAEIAAYLDQFNETQLTDAGLSYIMRSLNLNGYRE